MGMEVAAPNPSSRKRKALAPAATEAEDPGTPLPGMDGDGGGAGGDRTTDLPGAVLVDSVSLRPPAMEMETDVAAAAATADGHGSDSTAEDQEPALPGEDRLSGLPDGVLGDVISLLPTGEGARTQILASRWRHLWRSAPLNLDHHWICANKDDLDAVVSCVLAAHPGPGRRFCAPVYHLRGDRAATADAWLQSPALNNLQSSSCATPQPPPAAAFRFSDTLCVATFGDCHLTDSIVQALHFPKLQKLALKKVSISEWSLHTMIAACPSLECLIIQKSYGFHCVRINSSTLRGIGVEGYGSRGELKFGELIIENAPCLERLLQLGSTEPLHISVISAPKLGTLGCLSSEYCTTLAFDSTVIQRLRVDSLTTTVCSVKILAVHMHALSLDAVIDLMRCFPCLEKLYIESVGPGKTNLWRRKHQNLIRSLDIRLKTIVCGYYRDIKSHVDFATFFLLNVRVLELMTLRVDRKDYHERFFAQQRKIRPLDNRASAGARLHFTQDWSHHNAAHFRVHDLDLSDPFERRVPYQFRALC